MPMILLTNSYSGRPLEILQSVIPPDFEIDLLEKVDQQCLVEHASRADYLLVSGRLSINKEVLNAACKLKMIQRTGVGMDNFDLQAVAEKGIPIYVNRGVNSTSVAEHALYLMLAVLKRATLVSSSMREGKWKKQQLGTCCHTLSGKTIGLIGLGNIGRKVAKMVTAFGVNVCYADVQPLDTREEEDLHLTFMSLEALLAHADVVSLHCPLNESTRGMIDEQALSRMKNTAVLVNTARGALVDEGALVSALNTGVIAGAGLDTFETEPLASDSVLRNMPQVVVTPHIAGVTFEAFADMMSEAIRNIVLFERGKLHDIQDRRFQ